MHIFSWRSMPTGSCSSRLLASRPDRISRQVAASLERRGVTVSLGCSLERHGVFAVRQAPVLLNNLAAVLGGGPLDEFQPQERWLSILNLGAGEGLALWGRLSCQGSLALRLKDLIDRHFLDGYRNA